MLIVVGSEVHVKGVLGKETARKVLHIGVILDGI